MTPENTGGPYHYLAFIVDAPFIARFFLLLQQGVRIRRRVGCSVDLFLREEIGATPAMIEKVQSIVLDGKPVDDIGSALVHDGSVLALSAAMPGLVGATLRRGGAYSSLRGAITYHETGSACAPGEGWVTVKLFNLLMAEMGPDLLRTGVLLRSPDLQGLLAEQAHDLRQWCRRVTLDGAAVDAGMLGASSLLKGMEQVVLKVEAGLAGI